MPILSYIYVRNQTVPDDDKVLTPYHLGEVANRLMNKMGMHGAFNKGETDGATTSEGPPIEFVGKSQGAHQGRPRAR